MKTWQYAVTFEHESSGGPETVRGEVAAGSPQSAVSQAVREAKKAKRGIRYDSLLVLVQPKAAA